MRVLADIDGNGPLGFQMLVEFIGDDGKGGTDDLVRVGGTEHLTRVFQEFRLDIPAGATDLVLRIEARTNSSSEEIGFDNIRITATTMIDPPKPPANPSPSDTPKNVRDN